LWREGLALRPYFEDVRHIVANKQAIPPLRQYNMVDLQNLAFEHCPIVDCGITDDHKILELSRKLVFDISQGHVIYLHCWGGHGRTGTVVSIMLHIMYGVSIIDKIKLIMSHKYIL
jgi:protein tyrosine phosphatase